MKKKSPGKALKKTSGKKSVARADSLKGHSEGVHIGGSTKAKRSVRKAASRSIANKASVKKPAATKSPETGRATSSESGVVYRGRHLSIVVSNGWESCERVKASGVVSIVAVTPDRRLLLTEQMRPPVGRRCIELPSGLAGDLHDDENESLAKAAERELLEETGYTADRMEFLAQGPSSAGMTSEIITFFHAVGVRQTAAGGGDATEDITVHAIPLSWIRAWLREQETVGRLVDYRIYAGLYFLSDGESR